VKVLFFSHQADFIYGGEVSTLAFMRALGRQGVEVHLACPSGVFANRAREVAAVHAVPAIQFSRKLSHLPRLAPAIRGTRRALRALVKQERISLVHATSLKAMAYLAGFSAAPVIWHHHDILPERPSNRAWLRFLAWKAAKVLVPSRASREAMLRAGVPAEKIEVLYNGLDPAEWVARTSRDPSEPVRIGFVGEISERKGIDLLPDFVAALAGNGLDFSLSVVGGALSEPAFARALEEKMARESRVKFLGRREDVKALLQTFDFLWVPSRQEPFGIVAIEGAFSGLPVVAAPVGGLTEIVVHGETGYLAQGPEEMARAVAEGWEPGRWERLSLAARRRAEERFGLGALGERLRKTYEEIL
jgi:glycosyltransferase involved in cell wall biosynthesis